MPLARNNIAQRAKEAQINATRTPLGVHGLVEQAPPKFTATRRDCATEQDGNAPRKDTAKVMMGISLANGHKKCRDGARPVSTTEYSSPLRFVLGVKER